MKKLFAIAAVALLAGCATTEFKTFETRDAIREGQGGTKTVVDGMDIWSNGEPPRKYKILGIIEDERGAGGISQRMRNGDVVQKAKESGGDALIEGAVSSQITGAITNGFATAQSFGRTTNAFGSGVSVPIGMMNSKYTVIKYLD